MGWWGAGWGNRVPESAREVAKAFYAGKVKNRSSCRTNGLSYWFISSEGAQVEIARRVPDNEVLAEMEKALLGLPHQRKLEFSVRGWRTQTTARHLTALGLDARCYGVKRPKFWIKGRYMPDDWAGWFTLDDVSYWPTEDPEVAAKRKLAEQREQARQYRQGRQFVQMTAPLPF